MKNTRIVQRGIEELGLDDDMSKDKFTPSEAKPLVKDENGKPASGMFGYSSIVGMLLYLYGDTIPDFYLAVNSCSRYMFIPKRFSQIGI